MKKLIIFLLTITLVLGMCACRNTGSLSDNNSSDIVMNPSDNDVSSSEQNSTEDDDKSSDLTVPDNDSGNETLNNNSQNETGKVNTITLPGTENWSSNEDAYTLTVSNESIGKFNYMGYYLTGNTSRIYSEMSEKQKELFCEYVFEEQKINYVFVFVNTEFYYQSQSSGTDITHFMEEYCFGKGGLLEEIIERNIPVSAIIGSIPGFMQGESPYWIKEGYEDDFAKAVSNLVYDLTVEVGLNVVTMALGDEPDGFVGAEDSRCLAHYDKVVPLARKYLDQKGFANVGIIGPETCVTRSKWLNVLRSKDDVWNNMYAFSGHDFTSTGVVTETLFNQTRVTGKPLFTTSCGVINEFNTAGSVLTVNAKGEDYIADYYSAMCNTAMLINNVNLGMNAMCWWAPLAKVENLIELDGKASNFSHLFVSDDKDLFSNGIAKTATYGFFTQALQAVQPGATIYQCSTDKEGIMNGSFGECTLSVSAGRNADGTWGINLFNKTDSTIAAQHAGKDYVVVPKSAKTITVNLDIVGLYGTGAKEFEMYSTNTSGVINDYLGNITLVDGRGYIEVYATELISLRSVENIELNNKPLVITEEIKDLTIALEGKNHIIKNGKEVSLNGTFELKYYDDYRNSALVYEAEDFAKLIGAECEISNGVATIYNSVGKLTITVGESFAKYSGIKQGSLSLAEKAEVRDGKIYFALADATAVGIGGIFDIKYTQYEGTGLVVIGETDVINLGRFSALFN